MKSIKIAQNLADKLNQGVPPILAKREADDWNKGRRCPEGCIDPTKAVAYVFQGGLGTEAPRKYYSVYVAQGSGRVGIQEVSVWQYCQGLNFEAWKKSAFYSRSGPATPCTSTIRSSIYVLPAAARIWVLCASGANCSTRITTRL